MITKEKKVRALQIAIPHYIEYLKLDFADHTQMVSEYSSNSNVPESDKSKILAAINFHSTKMGEIDLDISDAKHMQFILAYTTKIYNEYGTEEGDLHFDELLEDGRDSKFISEIAESHFQMSMMDNYLSEEDLQNLLSYGITLDEYNEILKSLCKKNVKVLEPNRSVIEHEE